MEFIFREAAFHQRDMNLTRRNELYLKILEIGLHRIRDAAFNGDNWHSEVESDHLHNIPSYIAGGDGANHLYYLAKEVPGYLEQINYRKFDARFCVERYKPIWKELETLIPITGSPWEEDWLKLKAAGGFRGER